MGKRKKRKYIKQEASILFLIICAISTFFVKDNLTQGANNNTESTISTVSYKIEDIPEYNGEPYTIINNNIPEFKEEDFTTTSFEKYSDLDKLGRCGTAFANISKETMPAEYEMRTSINNVKPSGWQTKKYSKDIVSGEYLYNRCHLIAYKLSAENDNEKNLITGTKYFNINGMLPFETKLMDYLKENEKKHILYRVTPIYNGENLVANGVQMEAESVEDKGKSICFNVYIYNVQPGIEIDYKTGASKLSQ